LAADYITLTRLYVVDKKRNILLCDSSHFLCKTVGGSKKSSLWQLSSSKWRPSDARFLYTH